MEADWKDIERKPSSQALDGSVLIGSYLRQRPTQIDLIPLRDNVLILLVALYLILNYGFMHIRGPFGVPIGEMALLLAMLMINHKAVFPRFLRNAISIPLFIWWGAGLVHVAVNLSQYGFWAIRDASHVIESLFLYIGFAFAGNYKSLLKLVIWLPRTLMVCTIYSLTFPFRDVLIPFSPTLSSSQEMPVPIFFKYTNTVMMMTAFAACQLQNYIRLGKEKLLYIAVATVTLVLVLMPSRTLFLHLIILFGYFGFRMGARRLTKTLLIVVLPILLLVILSSLGLPLNSKYGEGFSLAGYLKVFLEIIPGYQADEMFSSGTEERLIWWKEVLENWSQSFNSIVFGMGYGFPLIDFRATGAVVVREPHNDLISILARGGLVALLSFAWFQLFIVNKSLRLAQSMRTNQTFGALTVAMLFIILGTLIFAIGEPPFTMPYFAVPYYFFSGVIIRMYAARHSLKTDYP